MRHAMLNVRTCHAMSPNIFFKCCQLTILAKMVQQTGLFPGFGSWINWEHWLLCGTPSNADKHLLEVSVLQFAGIKNSYNQYRQLRFTGKTHF
jgi:hypothetical protein